MKTGLSLFSALVFALAAPLPVPAAAQVPEAPELSLEHQMLVRCSAVFAVVAHRQTMGEEWALAYPAMGERGREFFVRASARVIDEAGLERAQVSTALAAEAQALRAQEDIQRVMPACLSALEASGL